MYLRSWLQMSVSPENPAGNRSSSRTSASETSIYQGGPFVAELGRKLPRYTRLWSEVVYMVVAGVGKSYRTIKILGKSAAGSLSSVSSFSDLGQLTNDLSLTTHRPWWSSVEMDLKGVGGHFCAAFLRVYVRVRGYQFQQTGYQPDVPGDNINVFLVSGRSWVFGLGIKVFLVPGRITPFSLRFLS